MRVTFYLVIINVILFVAQFMAPLAYEDGPDIITNILALKPLEAISGSYWQFVSYMFLHANVWHIFINMFILLLFGMAVEDSLGQKKFAFLYLTSGVGSALFFMLLTGLDALFLIGASGAVFGILAGYALLFPRNTVMIFPIFIPVPAILAVVLIAVAEAIFGLFALQAGVANFGHLGGMITAAIIMLYWKKGKPDIRTRTYEFVWE